MSQLALFDYQELDAETRIIVQQRTTEIKDLVRSTAENIVRIGEKLTEVQARLADHAGGSFVAWLEKEFGWSYRTAYNFINVFKRFGGFENFSKLDVATSALYMLAAPSTPQEAVDEIVERSESGEHITRAETKAVIEKHKKALEKFEPEMQPLIARIAEAQSKTLEIPLTDGLIERTGTVLKEATTTGCVDTGSGASTPFVAALSKEEEEAHKRRLVYIHENKEPEKSGGTPKALQMSESNEWYTPEKYIEAARRVMGVIDVDPASNPIANQVVKATTYYTLETNGFDKDWRGRVWLNPPYGRDEGESNQDKWSARLNEQYKAGITLEAVLLVNAVTDRKWFQPLWDYPICFTSERIKFYNTNGEAGQPTHGNAFVYFGSNIRRFVDEFSQFGVIAVRWNAEWLTAENLKSA